MIFFKIPVRSGHIFEPSQGRSEGHGVAQIGVRGEQFFSF